jgi:hypothetical protein
MIVEEGGTKKRTGYVGRRDGSLKAWPVKTLQQCDAKIRTL